MASGAIRDAYQQLNALEEQLDINTPVGIMARVDILLVEDSVEDAELTMSALDEMPQSWNIKWVQDGQDALDFLYGQGTDAVTDPGGEPRMIFLDLNLPRIGGIEVLEKIKKDTRLRRIPVVVLSGSNEQKDLERTYDLGVNSYIQKSVDLDRYFFSIRSTTFYWLVMPSREE